VSTCRHSPWEQASRRGTLVTRRPWASGDPRARRRIQPLGEGRPLSQGPRRACPSRGHTRELRHGDDDFQLPVVAARYPRRPRVPAIASATPAHRPATTRLVSNLGFVTRQAAPYGPRPGATNLVTFPRATWTGTWISASWRDSRVGYGGGRFAMDVNAIWVPHALEAAGTILDALKQLGIHAGDSRAAARHVRVVSVRRCNGPWPPGRAPSANSASRSRRARSPSAWRPGCGALPADERDYWNGGAASGGANRRTRCDSGASLDGAGRPIPIVNTDPATLLLLESLDPPGAQGPRGPDHAPLSHRPIRRQLGPCGRQRRLCRPRDLGELPPRCVSRAYVVWGREVNVLLAGLALQLRGSDAAAHHAAAPPPTPALARIGPKPWIVPDCGTRSCGATHRERPTGPVALRHPARTCSCGASPTSPFNISSTTNTMSNLHGIRHRPHRCLLPRAGRDRVLAARREKNVSADFFLSRAGM